ncbi:alpha/beta fold hydrolase [Actinoplanes sp. NPDC049668]|uniref:alpha/beta fold hydrolase n=1 Tax=unclassified Actinoplanes TaxID=2626549 RepID=UPI0033BE459F
MPDVLSNGVQLRYETLGDDDAPALLLIMGLGAQLIDWPQDFCELLAARGLRVIRFDNRDAGLSSALPQLGVPDVRGILGGDRATVPYLLADLATDAAGLLDALGVERAHVTGVSLGGMIAQQLTIDHPSRVASLCSIMSTTGDRAVGRPTPEAAALLGTPPAASREVAIANSIAAARLIGSPGFPATEQELLQRASAKYDRAYNPLGTLRQYAAALASPDRTAALGGVTAPTVVIHGEDDPLIAVSGGRATADAVPGADLLVIPGMGHDLPRATWPRIVDAIVGNTERAVAR